MASLNVEFRRPSDFTTSTTIKSTKARRQSSQHMTTACNRSGSVSIYFCLKTRITKLLLVLISSHMIMACPAPPQLSDNPNVVTSRRLLPCLSCELLVKLSCTLLWSLTTLKTRKTRGRRSTAADGTTSIQSSSSISVSL